MITWLDSYFLAGVIAGRNVHVVNLIEVAGIVAYHGPALIAGTGSLPGEMLEQYWVTSKCRFESWHRNLKLHSQLAEAGARFSPALRMDLRATLEEIFASEILTRCWTAVLVARDRRLRQGIDEPLARNVFDSHMEARRRALQVLLQSQVLTTTEAVALNRIRRRAERWSDVLLGGLLEAGDLTDLAVDAERALDFANDLSRRRGQPGGRHAWRLTMLALQAAFRGGFCERTANADANARLTASILGCFPNELFDSTGVSQSLWMTRLTALSSDVHGLIDDFIQVAAPRPARVESRRMR